MKSKILFFVTSFGLMTSVFNTNAQSIGGISLDNIANSAKSTVNSAVSSAKSLISNNKATTDNSMLGLWNYNGTACKFKTENLLKKAGGAIAAKAVESEMDGKCKNLGIEKGNTSFEFKNDNSFTMKWSTHSIGGKYVYDPTQNKVTLRYNILLSENAQVKLSGNKMTLLFDADKLLKLFSFMGSMSGDLTIKTAASLAKSYDGMLVGFDLKK